MSSSDRLMTIGHGGPRRNLCVYLGWSRTEAMTDFILRGAGSLDVTDYEIPKTSFLADTRQRAHDKYYTSGGNCWPDRWILTPMSSELMKELPHALSAEQARRRA